MHLSWRQKLNIKCISNESPDNKWNNTYGIWASELGSLGLESFLSHRWSDTVSFFGDGANSTGNIATNYSYDYGLINRESFKKLLKDVKEFNGLTKLQRK